MNQYICRQVGQWGSYSTDKSISFKNQNTIKVTQSVDESIMSNQIRYLI